MVLPGFDIVLDAVSGEYFLPGFNALAPGGRYVVYGAANWTPSGMFQAEHLWFPLHDESEKDFGHKETTLGDFFLCRSEIPI